MNQVNVLVVDEQWMVQAAIESLLQRDDNFNLVGLISTTEDCLNMLEEKKIDVLLLSYESKCINAKLILRYIEVHNININIIIMAASNNNIMENCLICYSVQGYILKTINGEKLKKVIRLVANGEKYFEYYNEYMKTEQEDKKREKIKMGDLTKREYDVLILIANGLYNKEIGIKLGISEKTVKNHVSNIFKKLDVTDRTQAAMYAVKNKLCEFV